MSDAREVRDKALCYVVRDGRLLVFRHVDASPEEVGLQVPAGSVRPGETPEAAALREGREETGLTGLRVVRPLGVVEYDITPYRFEVQRRHVFHLEVDGPVPERWTSFEEHDGVGDDPPRMPLDPPVRRARTAVRTGGSAGAAVRPSSGS